MTADERLRIADRLAWVAVALAAATSLAGLAIPDLYRDQDTLVRLTRADDWFRLAVVLPMLAIGLTTARRGSPGGRMAMLGSLATLVYLYGFLSFGAALGALTLGHIAILGLAFWSLVLASSAVDPLRIEVALGEHLPRQTTGIFLLAVAGLSVLQWGGTIISAVSSGTLPADVANLGLTTSPLYVVELAFAVPIMGVAGAGLLRRDAGQAWPAVPLLVFLTLLGLGLAWEAVFVAMLGAVFDAGMAIAGVLFLVIPALLLASVVRSRRRAAA